MMKMEANFRILYYQFMC